MRITGFRTLTTIQEWGRPVGDANGVFDDGVTVLPVVLVDTDAVSHKAVSSAPIAPNRAPWWPALRSGAADIVQTSAAWGVTHFLRVAALAHAHELPVSPIGNIPVGLLHAATAVPNHIASELQDLHPPVGIAVDHTVEDGAFVLGDAPGLGVRVDEDAIAALGPRPNHPRPDGPGVRPERAGKRLIADGVMAVKIDH